MDLRFSASDEAFAAEVRHFLDTHLTPDLRAAGRANAGIYCERPVAQKWLSILNDRGWAVPSWPVEHGGTGWSVAQHYLFARELVMADAPPVTPNATRMVGPVVMAFGTDEQKRQILPRIRSGEDWWAQGYSEPGSGSDLASLQCRAVRDGDHYVINGTKIWTSHAQFSNKIFCLVRTRFEGKAQAGISFLLFDMDLPGISIRPIITLAGDHEVNQVFFDDVRVPVSGLLGRENEGWTVAKYLLTHERSGQYAPRLRKELRLIRDLAARPGAVQADADFQARLAALEVEVEALEALEFRFMASLSQGEEPGARSSMMKVRGTELVQAATELAVEVLGPDAVPDYALARLTGGGNAVLGTPDVARPVPRFLNDRAATIYAGSNEIQRNILSGAVLGL
ncbi:acyl-CoA dehydrogenase family protein [Zavarzinia sp. CC-PAN008]|uniref:acyl-CoA dehydrogenase family protein n=1 Tax=Zavarzinia sp. CC-PAN008 TaxID=3243332 RepID=UPI003F746645